MSALPSKRGLAPCFHRGGGLRRFFECIRPFLENRGPQAPHARCRQGSSRRRPGPTLRALRAKCIPGPHKGTVAPSQRLRGGALPFVSVRSNGINSKRYAKPFFTLSKEPKTILDRFHCIPLFSRFASRRTQTSHLTAPESPVWPWLLPGPENLWCRDDRLTFAQTIAANRCTRLLAVQNSSTRAYIYHGGLGEAEPRPRRPPHPTAILINTHTTMSRLVENVS